MQACQMMMRAVYCTGQLQEPPWSGRDGCWTLRVPPAACRLAGWTGMMWVRMLRSRCAVLMAEWRLASRPGFITFRQLCIYACHCSVAALLISCLHRCALPGAACASAKAVADRVSTIDSSRFQGLLVRLQHRKHRYKCAGAAPRSLPLPVRPPACRCPQAHSMSAAAPDQLTIYTVGHSTRPLAELVALLKGAGVRQLVDVRTGPHSRTNPQVGVMGGLGAASRAGPHRSGLQLRSVPAAELPSSMRTCVPPSPACLRAVQPGGPGGRAAPQADYLHLDGQGAGRAAQAQHAAGLQRRLGECLVPRIRR